MVGGDGTLYRGRNAVKIDPNTGGIISVTKGYPYDYASLGVLNNNNGMVTSFAKNRVGTLGIFNPNGKGEPDYEITMSGLEGETMAISKDDIIYGIVNTHPASRLPTKIVAIQGDAPLAKSGWPRNFHDNQNTSNIEYGDVDLRQKVQ